MDFPQLKFTAIYTIAKHTQLKESQQVQKTWIVPSFFVYDTIHIFYLDLVNY